MADFKHLSVQDAKVLIDGGQVTVVDIRDPQAFEQGHIANAHSINDQNIETFLKEADRQKPLICCCYHGISSQSAASFFVEQGFQDVSSIDGGYERWRSVYGDH